MPYIPASQVRFPHESWTLIHVLVDQGPCTEAQPKWSLALGALQGEQVLAVRWSGLRTYPQATQLMGQPTWFIVPPEMEERLLGTVHPSTVAITDALLSR